MECDHRLYFDLPRRDAEDLWKKLFDDRGRDSSYTEKDTASELLDHDRNEDQNTTAGSSSGHRTTTSILPGPNTSAANITSSTRLAGGLTYFLSLFVSYIYDRSSAKRIPAAGSHPTPNPPNPQTTDPLYVHWCVDPALSIAGTRFTSIEMSANQRDSDNFIRTLRQTFWRMRGRWARWFSSKACHSIKFYKVSPKTFYISSKLTLCRSTKVSTA